MVHVVTQSCCNDAGCVTACPANAIHPTPDEPGFATAEMLYIDPSTCIDCGACIDECPVDAIFPETELNAKGERYLAINAAYYTDHPSAADTRGPAESREPSMAKTSPERTLRVAIVGAGPAGFYAAEELLRHPGVEVDMFDRSPTPYGLVRAGVAPDHPSTKGVERAFASIAASTSFRYLLNVEVGKHVMHADLTSRYGAVIYSSGASTDNRLGISGEDLAGSIPATDFVAWYNGHPDNADDTFDLSVHTAVVVGNGNVALDVARILVTDVEALAKTDIADHALAALAESRVREVQIVGRRGIAQAAYTNSEFLALSDLPGVDVVIDPSELTLDPSTASAFDDRTLDSTIMTKISLARAVAGRRPTARNKRVVFRYLLSPTEIRGANGVSALACVRNEFTGSPSGSVTSTADLSVVDCGLVMRAIGYRGRPIDCLPFDTSRSVVPNDQGRVLSEPAGETIAGVYVAGWIKRGASGGIGMNKRCGQETATSVLADFANDRLTMPTMSHHDLEELIAARGGTPVGSLGWLNIDRAERAAGARRGRRRVKIVRTDDLLRAAAR
ncbi:FAD-dependent oxidoreductase [Nocardia sp. NPDC050713]|uniref:FAD-dependent oxidoreductase n=1 Tax=Nocardia sp. NPDC050713 TaxID=3154511 RepID=UPI0033D4B85A